MRQHAVLFVCLGNICRSPLAEGIFRKLVSERGLDDQFVIDSCGTGAWHEGEPAHGGTRKIAEKFNIPMDAHRARQVTRQDFDIYSLLVAMDRSNYNDLISLGADRSKVMLLRELDDPGQDLDVPDPYYGGKDSFPLVYEMLNRCLLRLLDKLVASN